MGWLNILGALAQAVAAPSQRGGYQGIPTRITTARGGASGTRALEGEVYIMQDARDEIAQAEAETRRMLDEAYRDMIDLRVDTGVRRVEARLDQTAGKVIDLEGVIVSRLDSLQRCLDGVQLETTDLDKLGKKVNILLGAVVVIAVLCGFLLYRTF